MARLLITLLDSCEAWLQGKKEQQRKYPVLTGLFVLAFVYAVGELRPLSTLVGWLHTERDKAAVHQTDFKYRIDLLAELDRNIRVLQFYVWAWKHNWSSDFHFTQTVLPYAHFVTSQSATLADVYHTAFLGEVIRLYQKFDVAKEKIVAINTGSQSANVRDRDADYLRSLINESIALYKRIAAGMGDTTHQGRSYLTDIWENEEVLANNCQQFIEVERRKIATAPLSAPPLLKPSDKR